MKTPDPFLRHLVGAADRLAVWCVLALIFAGVSWTAAWERGLGLHTADGLRLLLAGLAGRQVDRTALTLLALSGGVGVLGATVVGGWLFRRWQRQAQLDVPAARLRGSRWESEQ